MTAVDPQLRTVPTPVADVPPADLRLTRICPYLAAADGNWRSASVAREHRCGAVAPPAPLATEKQRRLCLTPDYPSCPTFEAARAARPVAHDRAPTLPRPLANTTPVVLDHGRITITLPALGSDRSTGQAALIALMALAFAAIVLARLTGGGVPAFAADSATPTLAASGGPAASGDVKPSPAGSIGTGSAGPSTGAGSSIVSGSQPPTTAPSTRTYKVKAGDTLVGIAAKYKTTPKAITRLNNLKDPSNLVTGQVLKIP